MATFIPQKRLLVCCVDEECVLDISFFRRRLSGAFKRNTGFDAALDDAGASRVFDPADLEMLKERTPRDKKSTTKSEFVNLFRSQLRPVSDSIRESRANDGG